jgi:hypothetical protein
MESTTRARKGTFSERKASDNREANDGV